MLQRPLALVGPMAVGKSTVGRVLAQRMGARFVDTDRVIVERHGSIPEIFQRDGEQGFRTIESEVVAEALVPGTVVSLGGGAVLPERTRELLAGAVVVFLDTDLASVLPRIAGDAGRPLLAGHPAERWQELYDARRPVYEALADVVVDCRRLSIRATTDAVLQALPTGEARPATGPPTDDQQDDQQDDQHDDAHRDQPGAPSPNLTHEIGLHPHVD